MTQTFHASEARIRSFLDALDTGVPIDNGRPWSLLEMLTLAGCLHAAVVNHPPLWVEPGALEEMDNEKREAVEATHEQEIVETIRFLSRNALDVLGNRFGEELNVTGEVKGALAIGANGRPLVQLVREGDDQ